MWRLRLAGGLSDAEAAALNSPPQYCGVHMRCAYAWNFAGCQDGANVAPAAQGATQYLVTGMSFQHPSSQAQTWTPALTRGSFGALDLGEAAFNALFVASPTGIIKRLCPGCGSNHQEIYYKRLRARSGWNAHNNMGWTWSSSNNVLNDHFALFSTYANALAETSPWSFCNYDDSVRAIALRCCPCPLSSCCTH